MPRGGAWDMMERVGSRMMKFGVICGTVCMLLAGAARAADVPMSNARGTSAAQKEKQRQANWLTSFQQASVQARKDDRLILAYFRGSDWCDFCKTLDREVLN